MKGMEKKERSRLPFPDPVLGKFVTAIRGMRSVVFDIGNYVVRLQYTLPRTLNIFRPIALR